MEKITFKILFDATFCLILESHVSLNHGGSLRKNVNANKLDGVIRKNTVAKQWV